MSKNLVIVESPAKSKTITKYLGNDFTVKATMGHIVDLPEKEIGVDLENNFKPKYKVSSSKSKVVKELKSEAKKADKVYIATDPDREGEAIAWHVSNLISRKDLDMHRVQFNEITKTAVTKAIENPGSIDINKVNAQQARRILDRIVGYQVSPILWKTIYRGLSAGRVQSVALRVICEREDEIKAFKAEEYWSVIANLSHDGDKFSAKLHLIDGEKFKLTTEEETKSIASSVNGKPFVVSDVVSKKKSRKPAAPFITSTLQQDASRKLGFSAAKTMMVAQQLYEGLELGSAGTMGLITYMRTDSTRIADDAIDMVRSFILSKFGKEYLPKDKRTYGKSKTSQDAHEAIRPSQIGDEFEPDAIRKFLTNDQYRLYSLIWKRFVSCQMTNAEFDSNRVDISVENLVFRATGLLPRFDGFLKLYEESIEDKKDDSEGKNDRLPHVKKGEEVTLEKLVENQHFTQPPPRYSEASLVKELESRGIGRPSTYAQIIDTLKRRKYVTVDQKRFFTTEIGVLVNKILVKEFSSVFNVDFTAEMENELDKIEEGQFDWIDVLKNFYTPFSSTLENIKKHLKDLKASNQEVTDKICPECKTNNLVVKWSRNGKFLACQGFPECKHTEPLESDKPQDSGEKCDKCGGSMLVLNIKGSRFLGCSNYPECKNTKPISTGVKCPNDGCDGDLVERRTKRGKVFYGCSSYPKCDFATWDKPLNEKCPNCGNPILVEKETKAKGHFKKCQKCKSEFHD